MEEMKLKEFATLVFNARKKFDYVSLMKARDYHEKMVITQKCIQCILNYIEN